MANMRPPPYAIHPDIPDPCRLTVSDIERLAKAGVTMAFNDIAAYVNADPPRAERDFNGRISLVHLFWERYRRGHVIDPGLTYVAGLDVAAVERGDKVYVFVAPAGIDVEPQITEDLRCLYPSDALMAKVHLLEKYNK